MSELQVILKEQGVATENAKQLLEAFGAPFEEAGAILQNYQEIKVKDESDIAAMEEAKEKRLALKKVRTTVENKRKELKTDIVKAGKAIDSVARFVKEVITPAEEYLKTQEDFVKIKQENERLKIREERLGRLADLTETPDIYDLDNMNDEQFKALVGQLEHDRLMAKMALEREEKERQAAEEAERARQAAIEEENLKLKAEAEERERALVEERKAAEEVRLKAEALEREKREQEEAELKAQQAAEELKKKELLSPDKDKLIAWAHAIQTIDKPVVTSNEALEIVEQAVVFLNQLALKVQTKAQDL